MTVRSCRPRARSLPSKSSCLPSRPCLYFHLRGYCKLGSLCRFLHEPQKIRYVEKPKPPSLPAEPEALPTNFFKSLSTGLTEEVEGLRERAAEWRTTWRPTTPTEKLETWRREIRAQQLSDLFGEIRLRLLRPPDQSALPSADR
jgi:hypothetical protein